MVKIPSQRIILIPLNARQELNHDTNISLKKADKGTTTVALNIEDKIKEGQTQLDDREHYRPLVNPMVEEMNLTRTKPADRQQICNRSVLPKTDTV